MGLFFNRKKKISAAEIGNDQTYQELKQRYQEWERMGESTYQADDRISASAMVMNLLGQLDADRLNQYFMLEAHRETCGLVHPVFGRLHEGEDPYFTLTKRVNECMLMLEQAKKKAAEIEQVIASIPPVQVQINTSHPDEKHTLSEMPPIALTSITRSFNTGARLPAFCVIELRTSGASCINDHMMELCAIRFEEFRPVASFSLVLDTGKDLTAPSFGSIQESLEDFVGPLPIVSWNAAKTLKFLFVAGLDLITRRRAYDVQEISRKADHLEQGESDDFMTVAQSRGIYFRSDSLMTRCDVTGLLLQQDIQMITNKQ